jgi:hypothetical protein
MNHYLDHSVQAAFRHGLILTAVRPGSKRDRIDYQPISTYEQWRDYQAQYGPNINAAIALAHSNLCVIDVDTAGGLQKLRTMMPLARTVTVKTPRGFHLIYRRSHPGMIGSGDLYIGEEHIGEFLCGNHDFHYTMLPGSHQAPANYYRWLVALGAVEIPTYPSRIVEFMSCDHEPYYRDDTGEWWD